MGITTQTDLCSLKSAKLVPPGSPNASKIKQPSKRRLRKKEKFVALFAMLCCSVGSKKKHAKAETPLYNSDTFLGSVSIPALVLILFVLLIKCWVRIN